MRTDNDAQAQDVSPASAGWMFGFELEKAKLPACKIKVFVGSRFATVAIAQQIDNVSEIPLEIGYAMPLTGVVLDMSASIGGKKVSLEAKDAWEAAKDYEKARGNGHCPVMVADAGEDVCTFNLGKLEPGKSATVTVKYCIPMDCRGDMGSLRIPTVIAPRYGAPGDADRALYADVDLLAEYPMELEVAMVGEMRDVEVSSPSHPLQRVDNDRKLKQYSLNERAFKDRDIVLEFRGVKTTVFGTVVEDPFLPGHVVMIDAVDKAKSAPAKKKKRNLHILVDCSGSMSGDGEDIARRLLAAIASRLHTSDTVSLSCFGSNWISVMDSESGESGLENFRLATSRISANMGGTELRSALENVIRLHEDELGVDIVLLTDGLVSESSDIVERMRKAGLRIFAAGLGAAPRDSLLREIADATDGYAEFLSINSDAGRVAKSIAEKTAQAGRKIVKVDWNGADVEWHSSLPQPVFENVSTQIVGRLKAKDGKIPESVKIYFEGEDEPTEVILAHSGGQSREIAKIMARRWYCSELDPDKRRKIAKIYGLLSEDLVYIGVLRPEGAESRQAEETIIFGQMHAAGSHGWGTARANRGAGGASDQAYLACNSAPGMAMMKKRVFDSPRNYARALGPETTLPFLAEHYAHERLQDPMARYKLACRGQTGEGEPSIAPPVMPPIAPPIDIDLGGHLEGAPQRCPGRFLEAKSSEDAKRALSRLLLHVWESLVRNGIEEEAVWHSFVEATLDVLSSSEHKESIAVPWESLVTDECEKKLEKGSDATVVTIVKELLRPTLLPPKQWRHDFKGTFAKYVVNRLNSEKGNP